MTKTRKVFLGAFAAIFVFALAFFFTACTAQEYTLTFYDGDTVISTVVGEQGTSVEVPETSKDGYVFAGWYLNSDFSGDAVEIPATIPANNVSYYAKYAALRTITLDSDEGSYGTITITLAEGSNLYDGVQNYEPSKTGLVFGAWYIGDNEVTSSTLVPGYDVTLTAKYKVLYTVEFYLQSADDETSYELSSSLTETGYEWEGTNYTPTVSVLGYELVENDNAVENLTLSASDNVFRFYFNISVYSVTYSANVPDGASSTGVMSGASGNYNDEITLLDCGYSIDGYRFLGWATNPGATTAQYAAGDTYTITGNAYLYAIWDKGYSDRSGGSDYVFVTGDGTILFERAGVEFAGTYEMVNGMSVFTVTVGSVTLTGSLVSDYTFAFYNSALASTYTYTANYGTTTTVATLELDGYYNAVYTVGTGADQVVYEGTYSLYSSNTYYFSSTSGGFYFRLGTDSEGNDVFYSMGTEGYYGYLYLTNLYSLYASSGSYSYSALGYYYGYYVYCDGFGTGVIADSSNGVSGTYSYTVEEYTIAISGEDYTTLQLTFYDGDTEIYRIIIIPLSSFYAYLLYDGDFDSTFSVTGGGSLELDGYAYNATYTSADGTVLSGKYATEDSVVGGSYIDFVDDSGTYAYKFYLDESGNLTLCGADAGAYTYLDGLYYQYDYVIVLDGNGGATIYDASGTTVVTIAYGTYTVDGDEYTFTLDATKDVASGYTVYSEIVFIIFSDSVYEVVSYTLNGTKTENFVTYYADNGDSITMHGNGLFAYYDGIASYTGYNTSSGTGWYYGYYYDTAATSYVYLYFNLETDAEGNNVLVLFDLMPRTNYFYSQYNSTDTTVTLELDGLGNAVYTNGTAYSGTYAAKTSSVYTFIYEDGTSFDFMLLTSSSTSGYTYYFAVYDEVYNGTLTGTDGSSLTLDGFGFTATYTTADGTTYSGYYYFYDEDNDTILFSCDDLDYTVYFYLQDESTYIVTDNYAGLYYSASADGAIDGQYLIYLDGTGTALLYYYSTYTYYYYYYANYFYFYYNGYGSYASTYAQLYAQYGYLVTSNSTYLSYGRYYAINYAYSAIGTYVELDGETETMQITLSDGVEAALAEFPEPFTVKLSSGLNSVFYLYDSGFDTAFIADDGSVISLDGLGNATYVTAEGEKTTGDYKFVTGADGTEVVLIGDYAFAVDYENNSFELYATLYTSFYDVAYYSYGYGASDIVTIWTMADGTQTVSIDLTNSYYAYAGYMEYIYSYEGDVISIWFVPFITYSSGYYVYIEYIYEYDYTYTDSDSVEQTVTLHYDGLISLYYGMFVYGSQYDVTYITEAASGDYTVIEYIYLFGSYDDYSGDYSGYFYSFAVADANGDLLNYNYYYYNYINGVVYTYVDSGVYFYYVTGDIAYEKVYLVTIGSSVTISEVEKKTLVDNESKYTLYYVEYEGTLYALYFTLDGSVVTVYREVAINDAGTYTVIISGDGSYLLLDETGADRALYLCEAVTSMATADGDYAISFALVCAEKLYYVESFYYGDYSILSSGALGDEITVDNGVYTITFATDAADYVATVTYDATNGWTLSVVATTKVYTAAEGDVTVVFTLDESGAVNVTSVTNAGTDVTADYDSADYELTFNGTVTDGTVISITFSTDGTLSYVTEYIVVYYGETLGSYTYNSDGTVESYEVSDTYTVISAYYDDTYLTIVASYVKNETTYYSTCAITLGASNVTVESLAEKLVTFTNSESIAVEMTLLVNTSGEAEELLSMTYDGSSVTGSFYETSDGNYVVAYSYYAYVITLGDAATVVEYSRSYYYSSGYLYSSGRFLVKFTYTYNSEDSTLTVTSLDSFYAYENGQFVLVSTDGYTVTAGSGTCTATFTANGVTYEIVFYYTNSGRVLPEVYATAVLVAANNANASFTYTEYVTSSGLTLSPVSITVGSTTYSYSSNSSVATGVYLIAFLSDSDSTTLAYLLLDMSGSDLVCYLVQYETVTDGTYRFTVYYYATDEGVIIISLENFEVNESGVWTSTSAELEETESTGVYTFTYNGKTYNVTFTYESSALKITVAEVTE